MTDCWTPSVGRLLSVGGGYREPEPVFASRESRTTATERPYLHPSPRTMDWLSPFESSGLPGPVYHELRIAKVADRGLETIDEIRSQSPLPVSRVGEKISVYHDTVTLDDGDEPTTDTDAVSQGEGDLLRVERVGHHYVLVSPEGDAHDRYSDGVSVQTTVVVAFDPAPE